MSPVEAFLARLDGLTEAEREGLARAVLAATADILWVPNPGPQTDAFLTTADETFYGGQAGGGKTDLGIGLALAAHQRSLILRRINKDALKIVPRIEQILGGRAGYNGQLQRWRLPPLRSQACAPSIPAERLAAREQELRAPAESDASPASAITEAIAALPPSPSARTGEQPDAAARQIDIAGCELESDKQRFKGDPHDLIVFDEGTDFLESQYRFIIGWNRTVTPAQRCRVVVTSNPPTTAEGLWVIRYWAPWLDPTHPNPAKPGELRYFTTIAGEDREVDGPGPHVVPGEPRPVMARSRTYIPAALEDNPDLAATGYASVLAGLPEALRRAYRDGNFSATLRDADFQVVPTAWIIAAQERWRPDGHRESPMTAMAYDPAGGGADAAVLCWRHHGWYAPLVSARGAETADGSASAGTIIRHRRDNAPVIIDTGGGFAGGVMLRLNDNGIAHAGFNGADASTARTRDGQLRFANKRAEAWWRFREELDPDQQGGSVIALPPDPELRADLAAPTYEVTARGILIEGKDSLRKRLGRSPGRGDAAVMCLSEGNAAAKKYQQSRVPLQTTANRGYEAIKRPQR